MRCARRSGRCGNGGKFGSCATTSATTSRTAPITKRPARSAIVFPTAAPNLEPPDNIWPTEAAPVFQRREPGVELVQLRWGFPPARRKGAPVINFRSEGRRFPRGRCLITASHFFEFTGSKPPKSKCKLTHILYSSQQSLMHRVINQIGGLIWITLHLALCLRPLTLPALGPRPFM
jgi:putative SOS response-associated peptidase YedK